jgi:hypothetical protein
MRCRSRYRIAALLGITILARAENPETERRIKIAGVDPQLRKAVHQAIANGVKYLCALQHPDGSFQPGLDALAQAPDAGPWTALCGLALRHSGLPDGVAAARRALVYLIPDRDRPRPGLLQTVYAASLTALLAETESRKQAIATLGAVLARGQAPDGWWSYRTSPRDMGDLSNTQFAALALSACVRGGASVDRDVWQRHLESLVRMQMPDGSWSYGGVVPHSYPTGTFIGMANLLMVGERLDAGAAIAQARARALGVLPRDVRATLDTLDRGSLRDYYALYSMERACIFLGVENVGGRSWYADGARTLVRIQEANGSWSGRDYVYWATSSPGEAPRRNALRPSLEATAFALLFLARAPEHDRVTTPRPIDVSLTESEAAEPPHEAPKGQPDAKSSIPLGLAEQLLAVLTKQLGSKSTAPDALRSSLLAVIDAAGRLEGPGPEVEDWRSRLADVLLRALLCRGRQPASGDGIGRIAARALGDADPAVSPRFIAAIEDYIKDPPAGKADLAVLAESFRSLARLNRIESMRWLRDRMVRWKGTDESAACAVAALDAMTAFRDVPGQERNETFSLLLRSCPRPRGDGAPLAPAASELAEAHIRALQWLATDPRTLLPPRKDGPLCGWIVTFKDFETWFRTTDPKKAPWKD